MVTRKFNSAVEFESWLSATLLLLAYRQNACFNELSCESYLYRPLECAILHEYVGGCLSASSHVTKSLRDFVSTKTDPSLIPDDYCSFLGNSVRTSFASTADITYGCLLVDILCGFLDDLEVEIRDGAVYVEF